MSNADLSPLANHLWQTTLFVAAIWLLAFFLKGNRAQVRFWLWLAASMKFLIPFAALVAIGRQFDWRPSTSSGNPEVAFVIDTIGQPFSRAAVTMVPSSHAASGGLAAALPLLLLAIWFVGCAMHLLAWWVRWRRIAAVVRDAALFEDGRELDALRRLEPLVGTRRAVTLASSDSSLEPGVFGILDPVWLWPRGISQRLSDHQVDALVTHELCHVRRRDNLAAALHMIVEAVFWFHPAVWWIEKRLVDERERACDEEVIRLGSEPQIYAESILKTCQFCSGSPIACMTGVTGSDLKTRIEAIMRGRSRQPSSAWTALLLATLAVVAIAAPVSIGALNAPMLTIQAPAPGSPAFEVASVKPNNSGEFGGGFGGRPGGQLVVRNYTLWDIIRNAYDLQGFQIVGGPDWIRRDRFDILAKAAGDVPTPQMVRMVRTLLADRFKLVVHTETREIPIYAMVVARSDGRLGPQLHPSTTDCAGFRARGARPPAPQAPGDRPLCGMRTLPGRMMAGGYALVDVARNLSSVAGRSVIDRSGLTGTFDFDLTWTPDQLPPGPAPPNAPPIDPDGPSLFTAIQEQLGLKLESTRGPVEVLVVDSVEQPNPD